MQSAVGAAVVGHSAFQVTIDNDTLPHLGFLIGIAEIPQFLNPDRCRSIPGPLELLPLLLRADRPPASS
jgi:hypothetical protein